ncbi:MAG: AAA family ATPase [Bryobacteraceae bacterium]|nr:AAA family ATPase [Bryobacterales bacterium]MEB2359779.1 AAA family ATPase [Bryobacterales bacterium]NUM99762.1 AAA family ATPase [Bryobacteraceae bacterium]
MAATVPALGTQFRPKAPQTFEEAGVSQTLVTDLVLKRTMLQGSATLGALSGALKLSPAIIEMVFRQLRQQQLIEIKGMIGNDYQFVLSGAGRTLAADRFQINQYASACPVPLAGYHVGTKAQAAKVELDRRSIRRAFNDLVLTDRVLDQLGPALISQRGIFLYGPSGNGKTSIAERMLRVYQDAVLIPHAIEVDGQIVGVYDPVVHESLEFMDPDIDPRWVVCRRPCISVGGELVPSMLELHLDSVSGIYAAPLQMKANNGLLIIDDFGRQLMSPRDLLNRWIVPLDRRVDYLTLRYGVKFQIPFEVQVVFSTNLDPHDLADEAFLRRIQNKIYVEPVAGEVFDEIFRRVTTSRRVPCEEDSAAFLRELSLREGRTELRACFPLDICNILEAVAKYEKRPVQVNRKELERAAGMYFAKTEEV